MCFSQASLLTRLQVEREMGSGGFLLLYFAAGIFGFGNRVMVESVSLIPVIETCLVEISPWSQHRLLAPAEPSSAQ